MYKMSRRSTDLQRPQVSFSSSCICASSLIHTNRLTTMKLKSRPFPQPPSLKHQWEGEKTYAKECKLDRYLSLTHLMSVSVLSRAQTNEQKRGREEELVGGLHESGTLYCLVLAASCFCGCLLLLCGSVRVKQSGTENQLSR